MLASAHFQSLLSSAFKSSEKTVVFRLKYQTMKSFLVSTVVFAAVVCTVLCLSKSAKSTDGTCGPDSSNFICDLYTHGLNNADIILEHHIQMAMATTAASQLSARTL